MGRPESNERSPDGLNFSVLSPEDREKIIDMDEGRGKQPPSSDYDSVLYEIFMGEMTEIQLDGIQENEAMLYGPSQYLDDVEDELLDNPEEDQDEINLNPNISAHKKPFQLSLGF